MQFDQNRRFKDGAGWTAEPWKHLLYERRSSMPEQFQGIERILFERYLQARNQREQSSGNEGKINQKIRKSAQKSVVWNIPCFLSMGFQAWSRPVPIYGIIIPI